MFKKLFTKKMGILFLYFLLFCLVSYIVYIYSIEFFAVTPCPNTKFRTCPDPPIKGSNQPDPTCKYGRYSKITGGVCAGATDEKPSSGKCSSNTSCGSCSSAGGCVWCNDLKECVDQDRNGFPVKSQLSDPDACYGNKAIDFQTDCPSNSKVDITKGKYSVNMDTGYNPDPYYIPVYNDRGASSRYGKSNFPIYFSTDDDDDFTNDDYEPPPPPKKKKAKKKSRYVYY